MRRNRTCHGLERSCLWSFINIWKTGFWVFLKHLWPWVHLIERWQKSETNFDKPVRPKYEKIASYRFLVQSSVAAFKIKFQKDFSRIKMCLNKVQSWAFIFIDQSMLKNKFAEKIVTTSRHSYSLTVYTYPGEQSKLQHPLRNWNPDKQK